MNEQQIKRMSEPYARQIYNNIISTHNLVNIQQVKGRDLEVKNTDIYIYICTYSFPCQDLSLAGKGKGFSDTSTRSGMLWEVERILSEMDERPQVLLMENVPQVHSEDNKKDFFKWQLRLEELGYKNYVQDLIATDYGIPQTRNRCFMVSILGNYSYKFPQKQELKLKLKDMLEEHVDEKYYLSDKMKEYIFSEDDKYKVNKSNLKLNREIACSKTTREGNTRADTSDYITEENIVGFIPQWHQRGHIYDDLGSAPTICSTDYKTPKLVRIKNATAQGYIEAEEGDGVDISSRMQYHRGTVQKQKAQTISTMGGENVGVIVNE
jgi:DNA (cytosine-5)-methyltransferase 1